MTNKKGKASKKQTPCTAIVLSQAKEVVISRKFEMWCDHYLDKKNKKTYLNATQSALAVYDTEKYYSACRIGWENSRKLNMLASTIADLEGYGFGDRMRIALAKAASGNYSDWDKFLTRIGDFTDKPTSLTQNNFTISLADEIAKASQQRGLPV